MSDLIDFDSPSTTSPGAHMLASPLIPSPEAGPLVLSGQRRSVENNPFDMVLKKITDYERNKEDPFERVIEKAMGRVSIETKDDFVPRRKRHSDILKLNKTLDETESKMDLSLVAGVDDISIITDLNDTNLIADNVAGEKPAIVAWDCDNKIVTELNVSPSSCDADLSILNQSAMNDSLLDDQLTKEPSMNLFARPRSMSQCNFLSPEEPAPSKNNRRSMSVTDASKSNVYNVNSSILSAQSSLFDDPFNNAFRNSLKSSVSSNASSFNSQFDISKHRVERLNSDSSVFSGISNISAITTDPLSRIRQDRFGSESSNYSNISNLSVIPNNTVTSCDSSVFVNDTMNKGFVTSRSLLSSTSSVPSFKTPTKATDRSELIKQFYKIKSNMSLSQAEPKSSNITLAHEKDNSLLKSKTLPNNESLQKTEGKLIDVGCSLASISANETSINDIIFSEARTLAETFEKMASSRDSETNEEDLLFSKTQLNFDDLPPSDDEAVDNLIELSGGESEIKKSSEVTTESNTMSPKDEVKALENEFIEQKDPGKKAVAATLLLDLEKLIKEQDNPDAFKVLTDLQKLLGVECENNTEILQICLQNSMSSPDEKKPESNIDLSKSMADKNVEPNHCSQSTSNNEDNAKEISKNKSSNSSNDVADLHIGNESKDAPSDNVDSQSNSKKEPKVQKNNNETPEDDNLALNLLQTLNKIVSKNDGDSAVDILKSLSTVLSMASESKSKSKPVSTVKENRKSNAPKLMNRSTSSLYKSPSKSHLAAKKAPNASFEPAPIRRSISVNPALGKPSNNLLDVSGKDKRKSHLLGLKKRFPSDPGFADDADKKKVEVPVSKSTFGASKPAIEPIKTKLKIKPTSEVMSKKGPMKAIMPLGSMQKQGVKRTTNETGSVTPPPKSQESIPSLKIISSTPNSSANSKSKPTASSTPNMNGLKTQRVKAASQNSSKGTITCSLSPVSLNSSSKTNTSRKSGCAKSPLKKPSTPRKSESTESSRLPRYSPRPVRVRTSSFSDVKSSKSPQPSSGSLKVASEKTLRHSSVLSPLRNCNKLATKVKSMSLMPRLSKSIAPKSGPEKENYA